MTRKRILGGAGYYIVAVLLAVIALVPFVWMISTSLKSRGALMSIPIEWIPAEPTLDAYGEVFSRFPFLKTIGNSLFITCSFTLLTIVSASMAAFAFAKIRFRGSQLVLGLYLATMMIPTQVTMIPLFVVMNKLGLIDKAGAWFTVGDQRFQGRDNVRNYLLENPEVCDKLEQQIRDNAHKLMTPQARKAAIAAGRAVDVSADDFDEGE